MFYNGIMLYTEIIIKLKGECHLNNPKFSTTKIQTSWQLKPVQFLWRADLMSY